MRIDILTLFPGMFHGPFQESMLKRAQARGLVQISVWNIRDYAEDKHHVVDDYTYGGGAGMVMKPEPVYRCLEQVRSAGAAAGLATAAADDATGRGVPAAWPRISCPWLVLLCAL